MNKWSKIHSSILQLRNEAGFSLLVVAILITLAGGLIAALLSLAPELIKQEQTSEQEAVLPLADRQLTAFAAANGRLPCPDTTGDGVEDCGAAAKGSLPYRTLELGGAVSVENRVPIKYGVYRNTASNADLAVLVNRFEPTDHDGVAPSPPLNNLNVLDLCDGVDNAVAAGYNGAFTNVLNPAGGTSYNVAYAIAIAGRLDKDGVNGPFDLLNGGNTMGFQAPQHTPDSNYDDQVFARDFRGLLDVMNCDVTRRSLDILAAARAVETEVEDLAEAVKDGALFGALMAGVVDLVLVAKTAVGVAAVATAATVLGTASGVLAAEIAACVASLGAACGGVAHGVAAVAAAGVAVAAAAVGVGLNAAAVVRQSIALDMFIDVATRAGGSVTPPDTGPTYAQLAMDARASATAAVATAKTAASATNTAAVTAHNTIRNAQTNAGNSKTNADLLPLNVAPYLSGDTTTFKNAVTAMKTAANDLVTLAAVPLSTEDTAHAFITAGHNHSYAVPPNFPAAATAFLAAKSHYVSARPQVLAVRNKAVDLMNKAIDVYNNITPNPALPAPIVNPQYNNQVFYVSWTYYYADQARLQAEPNSMYDVEIKADEAAIKTQNAYDLDISATALENAAATGTTPPGTPIVRSLGAAAILNSADAKGVVK